MALKVGKSLWVERYDHSMKDEWDNHIKKSINGLFMFYRNYMDYHKDRFKDHSLVVRNVKHDMIAVLPANQEEGYLISHGGLTFGGLVVSKDVSQRKMIACFHEILSYVCVNQLAGIVYKHIPHIYHQSPAESDLYAIQKMGGKVIEINPSTVLDLKNPIKMKKGRKAQISRAVREGIEVHWREDKLSYKKFMDLENQVLSERHGKRAVHTTDEIYMLHGFFPENIVFVGGYDGDKLLAGALLYVYDEVVHTQYMAVDNEAKRIGALDLVISKVIDKYRATKKWLDFGISSENKGTYLNEGLISQKEGFGGRTNIYQIWQLEKEDNG